MRQSDRARAMDAAARRRVLYLVGVLLMTFDLQTCVHSQGADDIWFSLRNITYQNNSIVILEDIGDGNDALLCITNQTACCRNPVKGNWLFPNGSRVPSSGSQWDFHRTRGQMVVRLNRRRGGVEGIYRCEIPDAMTVTQNLYIGVYSASTAAVLRGITYQNNSVVILEDIGEGDDALLCITNQTACCRDPYTGEMGAALGNWFFPNGTRIPSEGSQWDFHRTRAQMVVLLLRRRGGVEGIYRCEIPDAQNVTQTIYIGVYSASTAAVLRGIPYKNNSIVTLEDIGEGDDALLCITNQTACCQPPYTGEMGVALGNWFFPNGTRVPSADLGSDIYRTRGQMVLHLNRRRGGVEGIYRCEIPDAMNVTQTIYIGVYSASTVLTLEATTTVCNSNIQPTNVPQCGRTNTTVGINSIQPTNILYGDGATTLPVIIVVSALIIIFFIIVGVVILVVLFKKKKQKLESNKLQNVTAEIELKLKQEGTTEKEDSSEEYQNQSNTFIGEYSEINVIPADSEYAFPADPSRLVSLSNPMFREMAPNPMYESIDQCHDHPSSSNVPQESACESLEMNLQNVTRVKEDQLSITEKEASSTTDQPLYAMVQKEVPPSVPSKSAELVEYLESKEKMIVPQRTASDVIYTTPDIASSQTVGTDNDEAVYSEPIHPSLFTDAVESASDSQSSLPYTSIYTIPTSLTKSEQMPLKVFGDNIREIHELGTGLFGKVILAETVGLSPKDLKMSESDDDRSKSTLVAVKTLKPGAPSITKEAFEKEINFMSRLNDRNVIRILGVCWEDTPFIMMEYMEKGDLNQYLQKFKELGTIDSEPQGQITTSTLVHITTQIASAMKYLASHNYVHRDLAARNCLVGPNCLVKISDFGMSRSLYESHYYCIQGQAILPVRWMSVECFYGKFSQKSDVWAFGITTWEIFTLAKEQPYIDMSDKQVIKDAIKSKERRLLPKPEMCPPEVYEIMLKCWAHNTKKRPTFDEIFQLLDSIHSVK